MPSLSRGHLLITFLACLVFRNRLKKPGFFDSACVQASDTQAEDHQKQSARWQIGKRAQQEVLRPKTPCHCSLFTITCRWPAIFIKSTQFKNANRFWGHAILFGEHIFAEYANCLHSYDLARSMSRPKKIMRTSRSRCARFCVYPSETRTAVSKQAAIGETIQSRRLGNAYFGLR